MPIDRELSDHVEPAPASPDELKWMKAISAYEFSAYSTKLELCCEEGRQTLMDLSGSVTGQSGDCMVGLFSSSGDLVLGASGTYFHSQTGVIPVKYVLKYFMDDPTVQVRDGDIFFCNDPIYGGIHNPDVINIVPIFWKGDLIAWSVAAEHIQDTGASEPGGFVPTAKSRYEEGLKVPPLKVAEGFGFRRDVLDMLANMVRNPSVFEIDMRARCSACTKVRDRVLEIADERGATFIKGLLRRVLNAVEDEVTSRVARLVDGTFRHTFFFDVAGDELGLRVVHVAINKKGKTITVDLSGSSPPTQSMVNAKPHQIRAVMVGDLLQSFFVDLPASSALLKPFRLKVPQNTCVNAPDEKAMTGTLRICAPVANAIHVCMDKLFYASDMRDGVVTPKGVYHGVTLGGSHGPGKMVLFTSKCNVAQGNPATPTHDGEDAIHHFFAGFSDCLDVEHVEMQRPVLLTLFRRIIMDHGGFGKFRGGASMSECTIARQPFRIVWGTSNVTFPINPGMMGGYYAPAYPLVELRGVDWQNMFTARKQDIPYSYHEAATMRGARVSNFAKQDVFAVGDAWLDVSGSSGGWGDPLERDPELVLKDFRNSVISAWVVKNVYHVIVDDTARVDYDGTKVERQQERERRLKRGRPFHEFEQQWQQKKPSDELLRYYGPWPWGIT